MFNWLRRRFTPRPLTELEQRRAEGRARALQELADLDDFPNAPRRLRLPRWFVQGWRAVRRASADTWWTAIAAVGMVASAWAAWELVLR